LGNEGNGVRIVDASDNLIGGDVEGSGNVIAGNGDEGMAGAGSGFDPHGESSSALPPLMGSGVWIEAKKLDKAQRNTVQGNFIGISRNNIPRANRGNGISIVNASQNIIGGTTAASRNIISSNLYYGVWIATINSDLPATSNKVEGNYIGTDKNGELPENTKAVLGNRAGVYIYQSSNNTIGGSTEARNLIANSLESGVVIDGEKADGNRISQNRIFENGKLGIDLVAPRDEDFNGLTPNDRVGHNGPNMLQNYPILHSVKPEGGVLIQGTLHGQPGKTFRIEFYANVQCIPKPIPVERRL
jgi:hypothetical protein